MGSMRGQHDALRAIAESMTFGSDRFPLRFSKAKSEQESELQRKGRRWLACAAAAIAAYVFLSGQYYPLSIERFGYYEDLEEEEEEH